MRSRRRRLRPASNAASDAASDATGACSLRRPFAPRSLRLGMLASIAAAATLLPGPAAAQFEAVLPEASTYRVRIAWNGGPPRKYRGVLTIDRGYVAELTPLGDAPESGGVALLDTGKVSIQQGAPQTRGAFDLTLSAQQDATLRLEMTSDAAPGVQTLEIPLNVAVRSTYEQELGNAGAVLTARRAADDRLRVASRRDQLIFRPGESFAFDVEAALVGVAPAEPLDIVCTLVQRRDGKQVWSSESQRITTPMQGFAKASFAAPMPEAEGVYTVRLAAYRPPGSVKAWLPRSSGALLAERRFQVVVFDPKPKPTAPGEGRTISELDPTTKRWWDRLPNWVWLRRAPWLDEGPLGSSEAEVIGDGVNRTVRLAGGSSAAPAWQAYPIPVPAAGRPYLVEVDYPADEPQRLVLTVMDQDRLGKAGPLGASAAVTVSEWGSGRKGEVRTARRLFWPRSPSPLLVLSNGDRERPARYSRIRVKTVDSETGPNPNRVDESGRWQLARFNAMNLPEVLGATYGGPPEHEDWQTFQETATRLADWVSLSGQDGAVVTVAAGGGTLYPTGVLGDRPTLDREPIATGVNDLPKKDVLELLLREFDRRGLRLVPWIATDGGSDAVRAASRELVRRYGDHPSLSGVAIELRDVLSPDTRGGSASAELLRVASAIGAEAATRRLVVFTESALADAAASNTINPRVGEELEAATVWSRIGCDPQRVAGHPEIALVVPRYTNGGERLSDEALRVQINTAFAATPKTAVALATPTTRQRLLDFEAASPFGTETTSGLLRIAARGDAAILASAELAGGGVPDLIIEDEQSLLLDDRLLTLRRRLKQSPSPRATARVVDQQPARVRCVDTAAGSVLQVANPSPWPASASVTVRTASESVLTADSMPPGRYSAGEHVLNLTLPPRHAELLRFSQPGVEPLGVRVRVDDAARDELRARLEDLRNRNLSAQRRFDQGPSPSFEEIGPDGRVADWSAVATGGSVSITTEAVADGKQAVRLASRGGAVGVQSRSFPMPATGQLAVVFSVRSRDLTDRSELRVTFEQQGGAYRSYTLMDARQLAEAEGVWWPYVLSVDDLPVAGDTQMRVRFDLTGGGQIDVDRLELYDLVFPLDFLGSESAKQRLALIKTIHAAKSALDADRLSDCRRLLEGYWPRFIREYTPLVAPASPEAVAASGRDGEAPGRPEVAGAAGREEDRAEPGPDETPALSERLRGYLPGFLRF